MAVGRANGTHFRLPPQVTAPPTGGISPQGLPRCWWAPYTAVSLVQELPWEPVTGTRSDAYTSHVQTGSLGLKGCCRAGSVSACPQELCPFSGCCPGVSGPSAPWKRSVLLEGSLPAPRAVSASPCNCCVFLPGRLVPNAPALPVPKCSRAAAPWCPCWGLNTSQPFQLHFLHSGSQKRASVCTCMWCMCVCACGSFRNS